jgi:hypothetical protein
LSRESQAACAGVIDLGFASHPPTPFSGPCVPLPPDMHVTFQGCGQAFFKGLSLALPGPLLRLLWRPQDLRRLVCGPVTISVSALRANAVYERVRDCSSRLGVHLLAVMMVDRPASPRFAPRRPASPCFAPQSFLCTGAAHACAYILHFRVHQCNAGDSDITWLWETLEEFSHSERVLFLQFTCAMPAMRPVMPTLTIEVCVHRLCLYVSVCACLRACIRVGVCWFTRGWQR